MSAIQQAAVTQVTTPGNSNYDPYYSNVSLLLSMNGSNGSTSFVDASLNTKTVTVNGNTQISTTQSKFGGSSAYFDGNGDYLSFASTTDFGFGLDDFTWEAWIYPLVLIGESGRGITDFRTTGSDPGTFFIDGDLGYRLAFWYGSKLGGTGTVLTTNTWYHVVLTRSSGVFRCFLNGTLDWQASATVNFGSSRPLGIGGSTASLLVGTSPFNGYIDDLRITKGIARYTANFTPPAFANPLTGAMYDPFYNNVSLLLHCNGVNGSTNFIDNSSSAKTVTVNGNTVLSSTQWKFNRSSAYFDGAGDWLNTADSDDYNVGTGNFTVEFWMYANDTQTAYAQMCGQRDAAGGVNSDSPWGIFRNNTANNLSFNYFTGSGNSGPATTTNTVYDSKWHHIALVRNGTDFRLYVDGQSDGFFTLTANFSFSNSTTQFSIGRAGAYDGQYYIGYIDDFRFTKGVARYTGSFKPPKLPFPDTGIQIDPYYDQTILLLPMNGANASTSFIDSSTTAKIITVNGNTQISTTQSKFGGSSAYFDGTTDSLSISAATTYDIFSSDFTVEFFVFFSGSSNNQCLFQIGSNNLNRANVSIASNLILVYSAVAGVGGTQISATAPAINTWHHVAWVKSGTTTSLYVNGVSVGTPVTGVSYPSGSMSLSIGADQINSGANCLLGYIDDLRVTKGMARYISNFTVPVRPNPTTGVQYDNYYNNVSLLLHMNGPNNGTSFIDSSPRANAVTANGNTITSTTQYKYGISSAYFDGTGDYLTLTTGEEFNFGTGDFTIECWVYVTNYTTERPILYKYITWATNVDFALRIDSSTGIVRFIGSDSGLIGIVSNSAISTNQWVHIAVTRSSGTTKMFINGITQTSTSTGNHLIPNDATTLYIGTDGSALSVYYLGYMDDLRITKGIARYTANFTPPTQAVPNQGPATDPYYSNTVLLLHCNGTNASTNFVDNSPLNKSISATGNAIISTTQSKFGGASAYFDGTGDYLSTPTTTDFSFGSNAFTIEAWVYIAGNSAQDGNTNRVASILTSGYPTTGTISAAYAFAIAGNSTTTGTGIILSAWVSNVEYTASCATYISQNTWHHLAVSRPANSIPILFVDGVSQFLTISQISGSLTVNTTTANPTYIGSNNFTGFLNQINGYIDDLRVTKGVARYINNFTPPQQAFPNFGPIPSAYPQISPSIQNTIDNNFNNVTLLLHMNGENASTIFPDNSYIPKTITANGNVQISTAQSKFGGSSAYFDGSGDSLSTPYTTANYDWWTSDFTIEAWVYASSFSTWSINAAGSTIPKMIGNMDTAGTANYWSFGPDSTSKVKFYYYNGAQVHTAISTETLSLNGWNHIAMVKTSAGIKLFANGIGTSDIAISGTPQSSAGINLTMGQYSTSMDGYVDDLRITKGIARYTSNFTLPSVPFPNVGPDADPFYNNTVLELHMNGANASTTFTDSSNSGKTVTANGNAQISTSVVKYGTGSLYLDGNGDYLSIPDNADFEFGSGNFTIECWVYLTASPTIYGTIIGKWAGTSNRTFLITVNSGPYTVTVYFNESLSYSTTAAITLNDWYHLAVVRLGNTFYTYINGVQCASYTNAITLVDGNGSLYIGAVQDVSPTRYTTGYIDDVRITKGIARYVNNFVIPQQELGNYNPTNDPFYNNTVLLLPCTGTNGSTTFTDNSYLPKTVTVNGNTQISTAQSKFGGGSAYFDGNGDYLSLANNTALNLSSGDFTIEGWFRWTGINSAPDFVNKDGQNNVSYPSYAVGISNSYLRLILGSGNNTSSLQIINSTVLAPINAWTHFAAVKNGTTLTVYQNGINVGSSAQTATITDGGKALLIGYQAGQPTSSYMDGYLSNIRIVKGIARYTVNFTPPSVPFFTTGPNPDPNYSNVTLALHMNGTNASTSFIDSSNSPKTITANGNAQISTTKSMFGGSSAYFDGVGDYLSVPNDTSLNLVGVDFTIEAWIYFTQLNTGNMQIINKDGTASLYPSYGMSVSSTGKLNGLVANSSGASIINLLTSNTIMPDNVWNHVAFTRSGSTLRIFINGILDLAFTQNITMVDGGRALGIGWQSGYSNGDTFYGYIDDLRVTKGTARYTSNFTPPSQEFGNYS